MAIAFDNAAYGSRLGSPATSITQSYTMGSGSNGFLIATFAVDANSGAEVITGATYNSVAMTQAVKVLNSDNSATGVWYYFYYLANPSTGAHNIVASFSTAESAVIGAASYTGVASTPNQSVAVDQHLVSNYTSTVHPTVANCWGVGLGLNFNFAIAPSTGTTGRALGNNGSFDFWSIGDSNGTITSGADYTFNWTNSAGYGATLGMVLAPATTVTRDSLFFGVNI